ncbi:DnaA ATPase domain-containing protein [Frigidibacter sp. ROC022]|uniref:DnaA ATPase domain-containing protein n=1 Tax=Frigidibacter sp. ROC022 TaxID=2971796 RepID=UPI00215B515B|nr:DnaA/Hda family protein [Frigidibacter sp. ROC022]MCR8722979.1 DnaA/Hda family protein [Frigidibacter sp. ROC022]
MARQLTFDLPARPALGRNDFYVAPANAEAARLVSGWRDWPEGKLALIGPAGCGKTHLARVWAAETGAVLVAPGTRPALPPGAHAVVEDVDRLAGDAAAEEALFHLHNEVLAQGGRLLVSGRVPPSGWPVALPDLASRMQATALARIAPPDDALLAAVLLKHFSDRQLLAPRDLVPWLLPRMPRSFAAAAELVARLDAEALAEARAVTRSLAQRVLDEMGAE